MDEGLREKISRESDMLKHAQKIKNIFIKADKKELALALENKALPSVCRALGLTEKELKDLMETGRSEARAVAERHPEFVKAAKQKK